MSYIYSLEKDNPSTPNFGSIKKENLATPELMAQDLENQCNQGNEIEKYNAWMRDLINNGAQLDPDHIEVLDEENQKERQKLRHEVLLNISKEKWGKVHYKDHAYGDFNQRYFCEGIMKYTEDEAGDKAYNKKVHDYIQMAQNGDFRLDSPEMQKPEVQKMREEFIQMHRDYIKKAVSIDIEEAIKEDISYEYCAKHAAEIYNSSLVALQFENIRKNFDEWGIEDIESTDLMKKQECCGNFLELAQMKISAMASSAFPYMSDPTAKFVGKLMSITPNEPKTSLDFNAYASEANLYESTALGAELHSVIRMFEETGINRKDVEIIVPGSDKDNPVYKVATDKASNYFDQTTDFVFTVKGHHDIQVPVHLDKNMSITKADMLRSLKGIKLQPPKPLGFFQKVSDAFNSLFYSETPNQKRYDAELKKYNNIIGIQKAVTKLDNKLKTIKDEEKQQEEKVEDKTAEKTVDKVAGVEINKVQEKKKNIYEKMNDIAASAIENDQTAKKMLKDLKDLTDITKHNTDKEPVSLAGSELSKIILKNVRDYNREHKEAPIKLDKDVIKELTNLEHRAEKIKDAKTVKEVQQTMKAESKKEAVL